MNNLGEPVEQNKAEHSIVVYIERADASSWWQRWWRMAGVVQLRPTRAVFAREKGIKGNFGE